MFMYLTQMQETCSIYFSWSLCALSLKQCVIIVLKLQNSQTQPAETFHIRTIMPEVLYPDSSWCVYQGLGPESPLLVARALICPLSLRDHQSFRWDEVLAFPSKLLREICMAVFWQPVALNQCFMTARENVSVFPPLIYAHWSLENMIIWLEQMDREIPKGFCAKRSHALHKWSPHAGERPWHLCSSPQRHVPLLLPDELHLCSREGSSLIIHNSESCNHKRA